MNGKAFGVLVASAVVALAGGTALAAQQEGTAGAKACYRKACGESIKGHKGTCGGTKAEGLVNEKACTDAGGVWTTADEAEQLKKNH
ncbi:MAG: hypothetical protein AB7V27_08845 [Candidatus Binatia bacterium]